jgi:hypothetical protein
VELFEALGREQTPMLERGEVHIGIRNDPGDPRFESHTLPPDEVLAACRPDIELGKAGMIDIARLAAYPLLLPQSGYSIRRLFDAACRIADVAPKVLLESRSRMTDNVHGPAESINQCGHQRNFVCKTEPLEARPMGGSAVTAEIGGDDLEAPMKHLGKWMPLPTGAVPEVAAALGVADTTIKTHLSRVFEKTGATRQADLVKLVAGFSSPVAA